MLQGTYLGIYINPVCEFWGSALNCRFCTTGQNVGGAENAAKTVEDVVETCWAAKEESHVSFVHLNGGFQGGHALAFAEPFVRAIKEEVGMLVGVQLTPERDFSKYDRLIDLGVDHFSFCVELLDPQWFARICPGKARTLGQKLFFDAMAYCAARLPRGAVSGELIAGIEPISLTIAGIERIAGLGAFPTVCIFRPTVGSHMADWAPLRTTRCAPSWRRCTTRAAGIGFLSGWRRTSRSALSSTPTMRRFWHRGLRGSTRMKRGAARCA